MASGQKQNDGPGDEIIFEVPGLEPEEILERSAAILRGFTQTPHAVLDDPRLSDGELRLYLVLRRYARQGDRCWPGQAKLAAETRVKERVVRKRLAALRAAGYLTWSKRFGTTNVYVIRHVPVALPEGAETSIRHGGAGLEEAPQSGTTVPLNPAPACRSIRHGGAAQSGTGVPTEEEREEEYTGEEDTDGIPPSAGELASANSRPAAPPPESPEGGSAALAAGGGGAASPAQTSFLAEPPSGPPARRRRRRAAGEPAGEGNWVAEFSGVHRERCGGEFPNFPAAGKALKALRIEHGHELLLAAWRLYVAGTEVKWIRVNDFTAKPKPWLDRARAGDAGASAPKQPERQAPRTVAELRAKYARRRVA